MEPGGATPLLDFFRRGDVDRDIRLMVAHCTLGLRPHEQLGLLELLVNDHDPEVAQTAAASLTAMGGASVAEAVAPAATASGEPKTESSLLQKISVMIPAQKLSLAMRGTREERAILIHDPNRMVALAVLSSPKLTETEVETIAKMANVSDEILRVIGHTRAWVKSYPIVTALTKNPKTPVGVSLTLLPRLHEKDVKMLATDRNIPDAVRLAARRRLTPK